MNSDQENQNHQVNYDFITNQGGDLSVSEKKPKDRRVLIIIILVGLTLVMALALALSTNNSVKEATSGDSEIPLKHLQYISQGQTEEATKLYVQADEIPPEVFDAFWLDLMSKKYNFSDCSVAKSEDTDSGKKVEVFCPYKDTEEGGIITYQLNKSSGLIEEVSDVVEVAEN
jgi:hypothetical protein